MRLYLSSFRVGAHPQRLLELVGNDRRTAVVNNALDAHPADSRTRGLGEELARLDEIGLTGEEVDLRDYFAAVNGAELARRLRGFGLLWVRGGNAFVLRRAAAASGFDQAVVDLLDEDAVAYGGYSAGVCLVTPSLRGLELCDDPREVPAGYPITETIWDGLGLLSYAVAPHYRSDHPETDRIDDVIENFIDNHVPFVALRDGEVITVDAHGPPQVLSRS